MREKKKIKEGRDRDKDNVCGGEKQEEEKKEKKKYEWNEMREKWNNIKNKKILIEKCYHNIFTINFK